MRGPTASRPISTRARATADPGRVLHAAIKGPIALGSASAPKASITSASPRRTASMRAGTAARSPIAPSARAALRRMVASRADTALMSGASARASPLAASRSMSVASSPRTQGCHPGCPNSASAAAAARRKDPRSSPSCSIR